MSSSAFPQLDLPNAPRTQRSLFQVLFTRYSTLNFTRESDRAVALSGLECRLEDFYKTKSLYGIVLSFFGESLLWQRQHEWMTVVPELKDKVPSWSWMAYTEEIRYGTVCTDSLSWKTDIILSYTNHLCTLTAPLVQISPQLPRHTL
jgi:hypothetical protein